MKYKDKQGKEIKKGDIVLQGKEGMSDYIFHILLILWGFMLGGTFATWLVFRKVKKMHGQVVKYVQSELNREKEATA